MPSFPYTPAALVLTGAEFNPEPIRFTYSVGRLSLSGASYAIGLAALDGTRLPRIQRSIAYFDRNGQATPQMQKHWQTAMERIEARFAAVTAALEASALAATALQAALAVQSSSDLTQSYINPVGVLTAASSGTITIAAHARVYGTTSVSVGGGSVSGFVPGNYVTIFYQDTARTGGAVTYQGTTSAVAQTGSTHVVGQVTIPASGAADAPGSGPLAPGYNPPPEKVDPRTIDYR